MKTWLAKICGVAMTGALALGLSSAAEAGKLEDIQSAGVLKVGIGLSGEPIGFRDAGNNPVGYDVDVAKKLADALGVKLDITDVTGAARITMLKSGQIDVAVANMTATVERAKAVDFSIPYLRTGIKLLVRKDAAIKSLADLAGKKVVVGRGTTGELLIKREVPKAELVYTDAFQPQAILLLNQKRAEAAIEDSTMIDYAALKNPDLQALTETYTADPIAMGVAKGDLEFVRFLDMFVSRYINSGDYQANYTHWFGQPGPQLNTAPW